MEIHLKLQKHKNKMHTHTCTHICIHEQTFMKCIKPIPIKKPISEQEKGSNARNGDNDTLKT